MPVDKYRERLHQNAQKDAGLALHDNRDFFRFGRKFSQNIIRGELNGQGKYRHYSIGHTQCGMVAVDFNLKSSRYVL